MALGKNSPSFVRSSLLAGTFRNPIAKAHGADHVNILFSFDYTDRDGQTNGHHFGVQGFSPPEVGCVPWSCQPIQIPDNFLQAVENIASVPADSIL